MVTQDSEGHAHWVCDACEGTGEVTAEIDHWSYKYDCHYQTTRTGECDECNGRGESNDTMAHDWAELDAICSCAECREIAAEEDGASAGLPVLAPQMEVA